MSSRQRVSLLGGRVYPVDVLVVGDRRVSFETNGFVMIVRYGVDADLTKQSAARHKDFAAIAAAKAKGLDDVVVTSVASLLELVGPSSLGTFAPCRECPGTGYVGDPGYRCPCCECEFCEEGERFTLPGRRPGLVLGQMFDLNNVASTIAIAGVSGSCAVWLREETSGQALYIDGPGWRLVIMGTTDTPRPDTPRVFCESWVA